nr:hypothetical protein [Paenibacillus thalictri]
MYMYRAVTPGPGQAAYPGALEQKARSLIGRPVGVSLKNGQGVSGVLCSVESGQIFMMQYLYHTQFATFHYAFQDIADILPFPACQYGPLY